MFETPLSPPSLLKFREGHRAPPCLIRYYGDDGKAILTAGVDRALRMTSVVRDSRSREISQGAHLLLLLAPYDLCLPLHWLSPVARMVRP